MGEQSFQEHGVWFDQLTRPKSLPNFFKLATRFEIGTKPPRALSVTPATSSRRRFATCKIRHLIHFSSKNPNSYSFAT